MIIRLTAILELFACGTDDLRKPRNISVLPFASIWMTRWRKKTLKRLFSQGVLKRKPDVPGCRVGSQQMAKPGVVTSD